MISRNFQMNAFAVILAVMATATLSAGSQAASAGNGIKRTAPIMQTSARAGQGVVTGVRARAGAKCKYVSTPYPHLECSF